MQALLVISALQIVLNGAISPLTDQPMRFLLQFATASVCLKENTEAASHSQGTKASPCWTKTGIKISEDPLPSVTS